MKFFLKLSSLLAVLIFVTSCTKDSSSSVTPTLATDQFILTAVTGGNGNNDPMGHDSVCVMFDKNEFPHGAHKDSIAASALLPAITTYLTTNYAGYTFTKAFKISDSTGVAKGFVVIINYNGNPVAISFDAAGVFKSVLEQRERGDVHGEDGHDGPGGHDGGRFDDRGPGHDGNDSISLVGLSGTIKSYLKANYGTDTLIKAFSDNGNVIVFSKNNGLFATTFTSAGIFVKRVQLNNHIKGVEVTIAQTALPAKTLAYLTATYPNYVFKLAESVTVNGVLQGYEVLINANNTRYSVEFDATGAFVSVKTCR